MSRILSVRRIAALAPAVALSCTLLAFPASALHPAELDPALCALPIDTLGDSLWTAGIEDGNDLYTDVDGGWNWTRGTQFTSSWTITGPRCSGLVHTLEVTAPHRDSSDPGRLVWQTFKATATNVDDQGAASSTPAVTSSNRTSATITFPPTTTQTRDFRIEGLAKVEDGHCLGLRLTVSRVDPNDGSETLEYESDNRDCRDSSGATSYR